MAQKIDLSIIIPEYNTKNLLNNCLYSIYEQTKNIAFEVIVVDNASQDNSASMIKTKYPQVKLIANSMNVGFGKANNQALKMSKGKFILFLNSDTVILDKAIEKALAFIDQNKEIDILGCKLIYPNGLIQPSGGFFPKLRQVFCWMFSLDNLALVSKIIKPYQQTRTDFYQQLQECDWVTGAFLLLKKKVVDKIGGFDEKFFMYSEEIDFCYRAKKAGFRVWFYPEAKIIHQKGKSSPDGFATAVLGEYQGIQKFYQKYKPGWEQPILKILLKIGAILRIVFFGILKGDTRIKKIYEKAFRLA